MNVPSTPAISPGLHTRPVDLIEACERLFARHAAEHDLRHYTGILTLQGLSRAGVALKERGAGEVVLDRARAALAPFLKGEVNFPCNFPNYHVGGNGAAYLWWSGELADVTEKTFLPFVEQLLKVAPRDRRGLYCHPAFPQGEGIFIDVAFAVAPFLLFCGLKLGRTDCVDEAWAQAGGLVKALRDERTGLVHQAFNFISPGTMTGDHWSRGNGWAALALAELAQAFPAEHAGRAELERVFVDFVEACLRVQDAKTGLWHQEMTDAGSYLEISGSGLMLYALGAGIEKGLLKEARHREAFARGIGGLTGFVGLDGSVHQVCIGCLAPGDGSRETYAKYPHARNDPHGFGAALMAFGQAIRLGIVSV
jgi:unsaturated rhamnogalacturonyl hydrolase